MTQKMEGFDGVLNQVGTFGRFQGLVLFCMTIQAFLSWHHLSAVFLAAVPPHWCKVDDLDESGWTLEQIRNFSIPKSARAGSPYAWEPCSYYDFNYTQILTESGSSFETAFSSTFTSGDDDGTTLPVKECVTEWNWDRSVYNSTVVSQFNLVCHRRLLVGTIQGTYMGGVLIGSLFFGSLSDQILGRRRSALISLFVSLFGGFGSGLVTSYQLFLLFRFILAAGVAGSYQNCYVLMLEYANPAARASLGLLGQLSFALGYMMLAVLGYFFRSWEDFQLVSTGIGLALISYYWILPESARWLLHRGDYDAAYKTLSYVAKINRKLIPEKEKLIQIFHQHHNGENNPSVSTNNESKLNARHANKLCSILLVSVDNYWKLLKTREIRKRTLLIWSLFIIVDLVYYGVVFDSATLTNDPFLLVFLAGLMEVPAYTLVIPCLTILGRKPTVIGTFTLTAVCSFIVAYTPAEYELIRVAVSMSGKLFITTCFAVLYLLGAELFPTSTRTTGLASAVIFGRLGSILAPFIVDLVKTSYRDLPNIIFGLVSVAAGLLSLLLPETKDSEMFDEITELEKNGNNNPPVSVQIKLNSGLDIGSAVDEKSRTESNGGLSGTSNYVIHNSP
ncbi:organic cation transporter protein [Folsomia candida]|uniref:organic cation transporter protein n=1 Tax=Folsomia candida TaxID=158441 RepID=UPI000B909430|nr:organic cation transporter protein [Folsomia candida]